MNKYRRRLILTLIFLAIVGGNAFVLAQTTTKPTPSQSKPNITEADLAEAKQALSALGYSLDVEAKGLDASLRHALIAVAALRSWLPCESIVHSRGTGRDGRFSCTSSG